MKTKCIVHTAVNEVSLCETEMRSPNHDEILVQAKYTCISPGTELRCLRGKRAGGSNFPYIPGYTMVGRIIDRGSKVTMPVGSVVLIDGTISAEGFSIQWGGHVGHAITKAENALVLLPGVDLRDAVVTPLAAIALHGLRYSRPAERESVAIIGLGVIGQCSARLYQLHGTETVAADRSLYRVETAKRANIKAVQIKDSIAATFAAYFPHGADVIVDATGVPAVLEDAIQVARDIPWDNSIRRPARYLVQGSYEDGFKVPYRTALQKELQFLVPRDKQRRDKEEILTLLAESRLQLKDLVTYIRRPQEAAETYAQLRNHEEELITAAFDWEQA